MYYQNVIGYPPAPSAPVLFERISQEMIDHFREKHEWIFLHENFCAFGAHRHAPDIIYMWAYKKNWRRAGLLMIETVKSGEMQS